MSPISLETANKQYSKYFDKYVLVSPDTKFVLGFIYLLKYSNRISIEVAISSMV